MATTRGTTPTHRFNTDIDLTQAEVLYVTYKQGSEIVLEKEKADIDIESDHIEFKLTQEDTLKFNSKGTVSIQIRARFADGTAVASNIISSGAKEILKDGEI